jgi:hypothetical protein
MALFRKRPVLVEAVQWLGTTESWTELYDLAAADGHSDMFSPSVSEQIHVETSHGLETVYVRDWIIKGVDGEYFTCPDSTFRALFDQVDPEEARGIQATHDAGCDCYSCDLERVTAQINRGGRTS